MRQSPLATMLDRIPTKRLLGFEWVRTWDGVSRLSNTFLRQVEAARSFAGFGIDDLFEVRLGQRRVTVRTAVAGGQVLSRYLDSYLVPRSEEWARNLAEQLCQILIRVHGSGTVHGALNPFNLRWRDGILSAWSMPTVLPELRNGCPTPWERLYCSPAVRDGEEPTAQDDFFSLGKLFEKIIGMEPGEPYPAELSEGGRQLISRCRGSHGNFRTAQELLLAVNPESSLVRLDPRSAARCIRLGTEAFLNGQSEAGLQAWREAVKHDWLDVAPRNNVAVVKMKNSQWEEALENLHEAYKIFSYHPVVDLNIGYCQWKLGDLEAADFWLNRSADLNPWFARPRLILAQLALEQGHDEVAMRQIRNFCAMLPKAKRGRLTLSAILDRVGDAREAERQRNLASTFPLEQDFESHLMPQAGPSWGRVRSESTARPDRGFPVRKVVHPRLGTGEQRPERGSQ